MEITDPSKKKIASLLKKTREKYNLSQDRFGKKIGLSGKSISAYETGRSVPPLHILEEITRVYDINIITLNEDKKNKLQSKIKDLASAINDLKNILDIEF
jgi:transcriptional regulator with XRE-family HTH domain